MTSLFVDYKVQKSTWKDGVLFKKWFNNGFVPQAKIPQLD